MTSHPNAASGGVLLTISGLQAHPAHAAGEGQALLLRFNLHNLTRHTRQLTVIADATDARGSFIASAACSLTLSSHAHAEKTLPLDAAPDGSLLLSIRENGVTVHTRHLPAPLLPFDPDKED